MQAANLTKFRVRVNFIMSLLVELEDIWQLLKQAYRVETLSLADISFLTSKPDRIVHRLWPPARGLKPVPSGGYLKDIVDEIRRLRSEPGRECNDSITMSAPTPE